MISKKNQITLPENTYLKTIFINYYKTEKQFITSSGIFTHN